MPLDIAPNPEGNVEIISGKAVVHGQIPMIHGTLYMPHHASCEKAADWRPAPAQKAQTSKDAAARAEPGAPNDRARIYALIVQAGPLTDEQIALRLDLNPSTARPRRVELVEQGLIEPASTATTRSGRSATTWRAVA